ncbi:MAG TPA: dihydroorotate dehydrogenase [Spirochaetota bacterium]|nr:dihydroorotate dehydrogenase [Spirochaetota bacterium]HOM39042.1 dihydroorotate dehydrogenase [Spirochaetota bacterium]HPQ49905.1 dihydroorotate dehydrogenase [Spirochaetota bacterium]
MELGLKVSGIYFKNPIITASGTFGYGIEFLDYFDVNLLGGITLKGISLNPKRGNPTPRIAETDSGLINSIGLENIGFDEFIKTKLPIIRNKLTNTVIIANVFGSTVEDYVKISEMFDNVPCISAIELNVSCPNVKEGGIAFGQDERVLGNLVKQVRKVVKNKKLIVKLSPNVSNISEFAYISQEEGIDMVSLINTIRAMKIDIKTGKPILANIIGGLSGPAIKPIAIRMVYEVAKRVSIPIIGMGGVSRYEDVIEFLMAGASLVSIGTQNLINPLSSLKILNDFSDYIITNKIKVSDLIGKAL